MPARMDNHANPWQIRAHARHNTVRNEPNTDNSVGDKHRVNFLLKFQHSKYNQPGGRMDLFSLDEHYSTLKHQLKNLEIHI